jgi:hypothetical protein
VLARAAAAGRRNRGAAAAGKRPEGEGGGGGGDGGDGDDAVDDIADSAKITAVLDEIAAIRDAAPEGEQPEQTVLFSQFTSFLDIVGPKIRTAGHSTLRLDGTQALPRRAAVVQAFRRGEANVLLVSLKAASLGLNLNCASRVILVDPWWNAAIEVGRCKLNPADVWLERARFQPLNLKSEKPVFNKPLRSNATCTATSRTRPSTGATASGRRAR